MLAQGDQTVALGEALRGDVQETAHRTYIARE
jgi:hypothetical protein